MESKKETEHSQKDFDKLFKYLKSVISINKTLSNTFFGITLTAFIFLITLGYPDIIDAVFLSLILLILSFFFFFTSTFLFHISELKLYRYYLYLGSELTLTERYEKSEKLHKRYYNSAILLLVWGLFCLLIAVILIFSTYSAGGFIIAVIFLIILGLLMVPMFLIPGIKKIFTKKKKIKN